MMANIWTYHDTATESAVFIRENPCLASSALSGATSGYSEHGAMFLTGNRQIVFKKVTVML